MVDANHDRPTDRKGSPSCAPARTAHTHCYREGRVPASVHPSRAHLEAVGRKEDGKPSAPTFGRLLQSPLAPQQVAAAHGNYMAVAGDGGTIRWQRGQVLGKGRNGVVYLALNEAKCAA